MTSTPASPVLPPHPDDPDDAALRRALRRALDKQPTGSDESARLDAAQHRWMHDWALHTGQLPAVPDAVAPRPAAANPKARPAEVSRRPARGSFNLAGVGAWFGPAGPRHATRWLGGLGVALALCAGVLLWQHHQNEMLLDELSQVDVLSQMAAGDL